MLLAFSWLTGRLACLDRSRDFIDPPPASIVIIVIAAAIRFLMAKQYTATQLPLSTYSYSSCALSYEYKHIVLERWEVKCFIEWTQSPKARGESRRKCCATAVSQDSGSEYSAVEQGVWRENRRRVRRSEATGVERTLWAKFGLIYE